MPSGVHQNRAPQDAQFAEIQRLYRELLMAAGLPLQPALTGQLVLHVGDGYVGQIDVMPVPQKVKLQRVAVDTKFLQARKGVDTRWIDP